MDARPVRSRAVIMDERTRRQHLLATGILEWQAAIEHVIVAGDGDSRVDLGAILTRLRHEQYLLLANWVIEYGVGPESTPGWGEWVRRHRTDLVKEVRDWFTAYELEEGGD